MAKKVNQHGVEAPVQLKESSKAKPAARQRELAATVAQKKAKHSTAFKKLARG